MDGTMRGLRIHPLAEEPHVLHLLPNQAAGDADLLAPNHHHLLPIQELLCHNRSKPTQHMVPRVHYHALGADA